MCDFSFKWKPIFNATKVICDSHQVVSQNHLLSIFICQCCLFGWAEHFYYDLLRDLTPMGFVNLASENQNCGVYLFANIFPMIDGNNFFPRSRTGWSVVYRTAYRKWEKVCGIKAKINTLYLKQTNENKLIYLSGSQSKMYIFYTWMYHVFTFRMRTLYRRVNICFQLL